MDKDEIIRDMIASKALKSEADYTYKTGTKVKKVAQTEELVTEALLRFY